MEVYPLPPPDFCKKLYELDPNLSLNWDPSHEVWSVWCKNPDNGGFEHVMNVVEPDGSYRPLDDRSLKIIKMNRYYAQRPEELEKILVDSIEEENERAEQRKLENAKYLNKDKALNRRWNNLIELARSVPWEDWATPKEFKTRTGDTLTWMPDVSIRNQAKPTELDADEIISRKDRI